MKKSIVQLLLAGILACVTVVSGCANSNQTTSIEGSTANKKTEKKIDYPTKQIEYVVPFDAGGGTDLVARSVAGYLSKEWGQSVIVVNKPGAGGMVGSQAVLKQGAKDGYTVLANGGTNTTLPNANMSNVQVKLDEHLFTNRFAEDFIAFTVKEDAPWKDFKEFCEWVKQNPEQLTWTAVGSGGLSVLAVAEWLNTIGVDYSKTRMIVTKGVAEAMPKIAGGHAVLGVHSVNEVSSMVKAGKVKILAVSSPKRSSYFPDVPTVEEQGIKGLTIKWWTGVSMPIGTPEEVVKRWEETTEKMVKDPTFIENLKKLTLEPSYLNKADFNKFVQEEGKYYTDLATKLGIRK